MLKRKNTLGALLLLISLVPLGFFIYTLLNLEVLQITITHPRVIVECSIFIILVLIGAWLVERE